MVSTYWKYELAGIRYFGISFLLVFIFLITPLSRQSTQSEGEDYRGSRFNQTVNWKSPPNTRSTYSIISSCILVWGLCMWSAIHLNIPSKSWAKWQWAEKCEWLIWGMLFPEAIAYQALQQNHCAGELRQTVGNILGIRNGSSLVPHVQSDQIPGAQRGWRSWLHFGGFKPADIEVYHTVKSLSFQLIRNYQMDRLQTLPWTKDVDWTLTHGFYTLMGGFAIKTNVCEEQFLPGNVTRVTLTVEGMKLLARHVPEMIPDIPPLSEIEDKSKANNASKVIACMQVLWFCLQCFERALRKLPISLFEITTMAHCVYALIIHFLWWKKPFSIEEPTTRVISGEKMGAILSYMWMSSAISCPLQDLHTCFPEFESMHFCPNMVKREALPAAKSFCHHPDSPTNSGGCLQGSGTGPSESSPPTTLDPMADTSASKVELVSSNPVSVVNTTTRTPVSNFVSSPDVSSDDPTICMCCGISSSTSRSQHSAAPLVITPSQTTNSIRLFPGEYLSIAGFCLRPESIRFQFFDPFTFELTKLEKNIYLETHDVNRWSLASLAITKYGLPAPSVQDLNYVDLKAAPLSGKWISSERRKQLHWKIAIINGLESMAYIIGWNYSYINEVFLRSCILLSFAPLISSLVCIGMFYLPYATCRQYTFFECLDALIRLDPRDGDDLRRNTRFWVLCIAVFSFLMYLGTKFFLILFSVDDLFYLPDEAYQVAAWSSYLPHIF